MQFFNPFYNLFIERRKRAALGCVLITDGRRGILSLLLEHMSL